MSRVLEPKIIETKQELLQALKNGQLHTSKYNLLSKNEQMFVELIVFGDYTAEQAMRVIDPTCRAPLALANRMLANPNIAATLEELTVQKDKKFMAEVSAARDMALSKLKYIMTTTKDDSLAAACAKTILDKANEAMKNTKKEEEQVGNITFAIKVDNTYIDGGSTSNKEDPVIITLDDQEENQIKATREKMRKELSDEQKATGKLPINPGTGLPYVISYEGVNAYVDNEED